MATYGRSIRRGLPRVAGGDPWPPGGDAVATVGADEIASADVEDSAAAAASALTSGAGDAAGSVAPAGQVDQAGSTDSVASVGAESAPAANDAAPAAPLAMGTLADPADLVRTRLRRGLPRVAGGEPWPPAGSEADASGAGSIPAAPSVSASSAVPAGASVSVATSAAASAAAAPAPAVAPAATSAPQVGAPSVALGEGVALRRGLPRVVGGEPWPPAGSVVQPTAAVDTATSASETVPSEAGTVAAEVATADVAQAPASGVAVAKPDVSTPLPFKKTVTAGRYANVPVAKSEPKRIGKFTRPQWLGIAALSGLVLLILAFTAVTFVNAFLTLPFMQDFLKTYPGEYHLPEEAEPGFPAWARWQHYLNAFFMLLIIKTGWTVRTDQRPSAFWTGRWRKDGKGKISLTLWLHQAIDILWLLNGIAFVVLLFATGHWMRVVPTSWEVIPNAVSSLLQYVSLNWPVENGWVNYNSLQQLMYFAVIFIAAPLAAITGVRMSGLWPKNAKALNKAYPVEVARAIHFPVMLFFVFFILIHVFLVLSTGALRNLNHMFAGTDEINWTGFWIFFAGLVVMIGAWFAARPLVVAPIAKVFGKVSAR